MTRPDGKFCWVIFDGEHILKSGYGDAKGVPNRAFGQALVKHDYYKVPPRDLVVIEENGALKVKLRTENNPDPRRAALAFERGAKKTAARQRQRDAKTARQDDLARLKDPMVRYVLSKYLK